MQRTEKRAFISYRRTNFHTALAVYQSLSQQGFDLFMEQKTGREENFSEVAKENIKNRAHFLVIISPSAIELCQIDESPLRKEIEFAIDEKRNIIPLVMEGFDAGSPSVQKAISGKLASLKNYSGLRLYSEYFYAGMEKLRERCLSAPSEEETIASLIRLIAQKTAEEKKEVESTPPVQMKELITEEWFERGVAFAQHGVFSDAAHAFTEVLRARPDFAEAYYRRGKVRREEGDFEGSISDFEETLHLWPDFAKAYLGKGITESKQSNFKKAIKDFNRALKIQPDYTGAYYHRGNARGEKGDVKGAIADYDEAIRINPEFAEAYNHRGLERYNQDNFTGARSDYDAAIRIHPDLADAYNSRGLVRGIQKEIKGAISDFTHAIHIQPDFAGAFYNRATLRQQQKKYKAAIIDYQKYLKLGKGIQYGNQEKVRQIIRDLRKKLKSIG
jgi:tetratricopeptide (TPR) repeat protein